jgi:hypothetical protein
LQKLFPDSPRRTAAREAVRIVTEDTSFAEIALSRR